MNARTGRFCHRRTRFPLLSLLVLCAYSSHVIAYGVYENVIAPGGDASELFSTASPTPAPFEMDIGLEAIEGYLDPDDLDFADMYCLIIGGRFTPAQFTVTTVAPEGDGHTPRLRDPQLFLFDAAGHPVTGNDDTAAGNFESTIPLGTVTKAGLYILAVTGTGYNPVDAALNALFTANLTGLKTPIDATGVQAGWTGTHDQEGYYRLKFGTGEGHDLPPVGTRVPGAEHWVPEPDVNALLLLGIGAAAWTRRTRHAHARSAPR